jgi:hypothetical protein
VTCSKSLFGKKVRIVTVQNTYLSINGFEAFTGSVGSTSTTTTSTKVGNGSSTYNIKAGTKAGLNQGTARQSTNYGNNSFPASNAFKGPNKFTHTNAGVGQWWEVKFNQEYLVGSVKIRNRKSCCGNRLSRTKVFIDDELCGQVEPGARNG